MKIISVIGTSGSGKTYLIEKIIRKLKFELNLEVGVIKYIHQHPIDDEGKDSFRFSESGAVFSIIKNKFDESAIFLKKKINLDELIIWLENSPLKLDVIFLESFRNLPYPTILCAANLNQIGEQLNENVKMISGLITTSDFSQSEEIDSPIVDIEKNFKEFCKVFELFEEI
ncbi:MAG: molybdopterin-guanine dinucleotide biosynthesis protein B [Candidatus Lokiarchaeota archaeon]|nr:molybdopterin-guanine dinucleotide biosynthesis protein B [Candidatus Lokiarchaeota archaeon]